MKHCDCSTFVDESCGRLLKIPVHLRLDENHPIQQLLHNFIFVLIVRIVDLLPLDLGFLVYGCLS